MTQRIIFDILFHTVNRKYNEPQIQWTAESETDGQEHFPILKNHHDKETLIYFTVYRAWNKKPLVHWN